MGPLQAAKTGYKYVLMMIDSFSKFMIASPLREQTATTVTEAIIKDLFCRFGLPEIIVSDQGTQFMSATFEDLMNLWGIKHNKTVAYHQSANGQVERFNRTLSDMIVTTTQGRDWPFTLPHLCFAYNTSVNQQIGQSPFFITHGFDPLLPSESALKISRKTYTDISIYVQEANARLNLAKEIVKENLQKCAEKMRKYQNHTKIIPWTEGMLILKRKVGKIGKFDNRFEGPFRLISVETPNLKLKKLSGDFEEFLAHMDQCKPFAETNNDEIRKKDKKIFADKNIEEEESDESEEEIQINSVKICENFCENVAKKCATPHNFPLCSNFAPLFSDSAHEFSYLLENDPFNNLDISQDSQSNKFPTYHHHHHHQAMPNSRNSGVSVDVSGDEEEYDPFPKAPPSKKQRNEEKTEEKSDEKPKKNEMGKNESKLGLTEEEIDKNVEKLMQVIERKYKEAREKKKAEKKGEIGVQTEPIP
jgi:hypothetical protein